MHKTQITLRRFKNDLSPEQPLNLIPDSTWREASSKLSSASKVAVCCHISPDGDALGSMIGLGRYLARSGKKVWMSWGSPSIKIPPQYAFLPGLEEVVAHDQVPVDVDVFVAIDCGDVSRLELLTDKFTSAAYRINIDHHLSNPAFGDTNLVDAERASSSELAYELVRRMGGVPDPAEATCFYTGIVTDTGRFQYSNTTPATLMEAAELRKLGVDHEMVSEEIFEKASFAYLSVLGTVLSRARLEGALVWSWMAPQDLGGLPMDETEHFIDMLRVVKEAKVAALFKKQSDGDWKGSLRSRGEVDVAAIAQTFAGGGHERAAGFTASGELEAIAGKVREAVGG